MKRDALARAAIDWKASDSGGKWAAQGSAGLQLRPQQQPAEKHPMRPMNWPKATDGMRVSAQGRKGIFFTRRYTAAASAAAMNPP